MIEILASREQRQRWRWMAEQRGFILDPFRFGTAVTYTTWNPSDKATNITLSNGNLTASNANSSHQAVRAIANANSGKKYYEMLIDNANTGGWYIYGVGKSTAGLGVGSYVGVDANGWGWQMSKATPDRWNSGSSNAYGAQCNNGDVIGILLDITGGTLEWSKNGTGQGTAYSSLSGTFYPMISILGAIGGRSATARFDPATWSNTPSGYTYW